MADQLTEASSARTEWSERLHAVGAISSALAIALLGLSQISEGNAAWISVLGSIAIAFGLWLGRRAQRVNWGARFVRRRSLLADALGYPDALAEGLDAAVDIPGKQSAWPVVDRAAAPYYSSTGEQGIERLRQNLIESAIWTEYLFRTASVRTLKRSLIVLVLAIGMASFVLLTGKGNLDTSSALQLLSVALVFIVSADQLDASEKWRWAARKVRDARLALAQVGAAGADPNVARIWAVFSDYAVLTSIAPAIPRQLYKRHSGKITVLSKALAPPAPPAGRKKQL